MSTRSASFTSYVFGLVAAGLCLVSAPMPATAQTAGDIDIVVEAQTYRPAFYQGAALPSAGAPVRLVAVPHFGSAAGLVYTWRVNGVTLFGSSRLGQNTATFDMPFAGVANITLRAETPDGSRAAETSTTLRSADPVVAVYEDDALYGILPVSGGRRPVDKGEVTLRAEPYFFNRAALAAPGTGYRWAVDGRTVANPSADPRIITFARSGGASVATISFGLQSAEGTLQSAAASFRLEFTGTSAGLD